MERFPLLLPMFSRGDRDTTGFVRLVAAIEAAVLGEWVLGEELCLDGAPVLLTGGRDEEDGSDGDLLVGGPRPPDPPLGFGVPGLLVLFTLEEDDTPVDVLDEEMPILALLEEDLYIPDVLVTVSFIPELCLTVNWSELEYFIFPSEFFNIASLSLESFISVGLSLFSDDLKPNSDLGAEGSAEVCGNTGVTTFVSLAMTALSEPFLDLAGLFRLLLEAVAVEVGTIVMLGADEDVGDGRAGRGLGATGVIVVEEGRLCFSFRAPGEAEVFEEENLEGEVLEPESEWVPEL